MATLVLTALGAVVGGPAGAGIGAAIGQGIDHAVLFKPATRAGPRLGELRVQTSSYGSAIPKLFGTMRVAGTVIWATDLVESRNRQGGGKGRPTTETYSYSASFAVLLSGRPIVAVRRIWADGTLLRGAAGDWKATTGFRLHLGSEEQALDPLIASAEGALAPAHRGCAYAVFEGLQLADYGNRIPSLTFEVVADEAALSVGAIAAALAAEVVGGAGTTVNGFAAAGSDVAGVLETLAAIGGAWWRPDGAGLAMLDAPAGTVREVADTGVTAARGDRRSRQIAGAASVAHAVSVAHYDPARDYQLGVQEARRRGTGERIERIELPAALGAGAAKAIAEAALTRGETARTRRTVRCGLDCLDVVPGDVVAIAGEAGRWRVREAALEAMAVTLTLAPLASPTLPATVATSGRVLAAADAAIGTTRLTAVELPALGDVPLAVPRVLVAACGTEPGWRRAGLLYSLDDGASWVEAGPTAAPAVMGVIETVPLATGAALVDRRSAPVIRLSRTDMMLADADAGRIDASANLALLGDELIQFGGAEPLGGGRWRLRELRRGRRGTEAAIGTQAAGDRFVLLEPDTLRAIDLPGAAIGQRLSLLASGVGDTGGPVAATVLLTGASVVPPAPVRLRGCLLSDGLVLDWVRRSRAGWRWLDGVDAPLVEESERYVVTVAGAASERLMRECATPMLTIAAAELPPAPWRIAVRQRGTLGLSAAARIDVGGE